MTSTWEVAQIRRATDAAAREIHAVGDDGTWGRVATARDCDVGDLARVVSHAAARTAMLVALQRMGIEVTHG